MMSPHLGRIVGATIRIESQRTREAFEPRVGSPEARGLRIVFSK